MSNDEFVLAIKRYTVRVLPAQVLGFQALVLEMTPWGEPEVWPVAWSPTEAGAKAAAERWIADRKQRLARIRTTLRKDPA